MLLVRNLNNPIGNINFAALKYKIKYKLAMINHVVLFKLNDYPADEKAQVIDELKSLLEGLKDKIEEVKYIEVGLNYELESKSYDLCLLSHFETIEDLGKYRVHPEHLKVVKRIGETTSARSAVDFEF